MINKFFIYLFNLFFVFIILLNVMMFFHLGVFGSSSNYYFGITTIIDIFNFDTQQSGTFPYYIMQALNWINDMTSNISIGLVKAVQNAIDGWTFNIDWLPYTEIEGFGTFFANIGTFFNNFGLIFSGFGWTLVAIFEFLAMIASVITTLFVYLIYILACLTALISGQYYSVIPQGTFSYPSSPIVYGLTPIFTI